MKKRRGETARSTIVRTSLPPATLAASVLRALREPPREAGDALERRLRTWSWERYAEVAIAAYQRAIALGGARAAGVASAG